MKIDARCKKQLQIIGRGEEYSFFKTFKRATGILKGPFAFLELKVLIISIIIISKLATDKRKNLNCKDYQGLSKNLRHDLYVQPVPRLNVDFKAEPCRSSLTGFRHISDSDLKNIILSAKPKSYSLDALPTWLLKNCIDVLLPSQT